MKFLASNPVRFAGIVRPSFGRTQIGDSAPTRCTAKSACRHLAAARAAADVLPSLPGPGETAHCLLLGRYDLMGVIAATVDRLPARCLHLRTATLAMSRRNATGLVELLAGRKVETLTLVVSKFFVAHNPDLFAFVRDELREFGTRVRVAAARNHAKVTTFDLADGTGYVFESSANLRSNGCSEFLTAFRDRTLHDWHADWIDERVTVYDREEKAREAAEPAAG